MIKWKHPGTGLYLSKNFRIFFEESKWWLSDIRKGVLKCPSWECKTATEARELAEVIKFKPCGHYHDIR